MEDDGLRVGRRGRKSTAWAVVATLWFGVLGAAAFTIWESMRRSHPNSNQKGKNLAHRDLRRFQFSDSDFRGADLTGADLRSADLRRANLAGANLQTADLGGANLGAAFYDRGTRWPQGFDPAAHGALLVAPGADLSGGPMWDQVMEGVDLRGVNLRKADLREAWLARCDLRRADLRGADLRGAWLQTSNLRGARLAGARYNSRTVWPKGADPISAGAVQVPE